MENATKALIIAGGVLIGILILTLALYLFVSFGNKSASVHEQIREDQIAQFNSQFTVFLDRDTITIYDIVTVAKAAYEYNQTADNAHITVKLTAYPGGLTGTPPINGDLSQEAWQSAFEKLFESDRNKMQAIISSRNSALADEIGYLPRYECKGNNAITFDTDTGRVNGITFKYIGV